MKANDDYIKKAFHQKMQRIEDDSFTNNIVTKHLADKKIIRTSTFINFLPMIIGLSIVLLSIGFVFFLRLNSALIKDIGLTENHGLIILTLSIIFLIYKWIEEITAPNNVYSA